MRREALVLLVLAGVVVAGAWGIYELTTPEVREFRGILLDSPQRAPDFTLMDHLGNSVSIRDFRGRTVVLTFLYTYCPDYCPLITAKFVAIEKTYHESLGDDVVFIAITTDPQRDTPERIREYSDAYGYEGYFLTGPSEELESVWEDYGVYVEYVELGESDADSANILGGVGEYGVNHTTKVLLIDKEGTVRVVHLGASWETEDLVNDIIILRDG